MKYLILIFLVALPSAVRADGWGCNGQDPNMRFCADLAETDGGFALDKGWRDTRGTLNGGPARINRPSFEVKFGSNPYATLPPKTYRFTATVGEDISWPDTNFLDLTGSANMTCWTMSMADLTTDVVSSVWGWGDPANSTIGVNIRTTNGRGLIYGFTGIADFQFNATLNDTLPHTYCAWWDTATSQVLLYRDGKFDKRYTGVSPQTGGTGAVTVARRHNNGHGEWAGSAAYLRMRTTPGMREFQATQLMVGYDVFVRGSNSGSGLR